MKSELKNIIQKIPKEPGVYQFFNIKKQIIYIGKGKNLRNRVKSYFNIKSQSPKNISMLKNIADIDIPKKYKLFIQRLEYTLLYQ